MLRSTRQNSTWNYRDRIIAVLLIVVIVYSCYTLYYRTYYRVEDRIEQKPSIEVAVLSTSQGDIVFKLFPESAPQTVENFKYLISKEAYSPGCFYRAEKDFVLQGGLDSSRKLDLPVATIPLEYKLPNSPRMVSMARTSDPNSGSSEFAIQLADNSKWLGPGGADQHGYAVFAQVVEGWDVVEEIMKQPVSQRGSLRYLEQKVFFKARLEMRFS